MALVKITGGIFSSIRRWVFDKRKTLTPNPFKPAKKKTIIELQLNGDNLRDILFKTHDPSTGLINKIVDLVNDLERRVITNETEIQGLKTVDQTKSAIGHSHVTSPTGGPSGPAMSRKGGKLQRGGLTIPKPTIRTEEDPAQRLITVNYDLPSGPSYIGFPFNFPYDNSLATILRTAETPNSRYSSI
jgi:hypothetical protein